MNSRPFPSHSRPFAAQAAQATFADYKAAVGRYSQLAGRYQSELLAMYRLEVSPLKAAIHLFLIHNR
jgi:hypothetical protein